MYNLSLTALAANPFAVSAIILFLYMSWAFLIALYLRNNSIVDIGYGLGFIMVAATILFNFGEHPLGGVITTLVSIWGLRLAIRIHERNRNRPEDFRYAAWRAKWTWFKTRSFFQIFMLQGFIIFLIVSPVVYADSMAADPRLQYLSVIGVLVWIIGFLFESVGDYQLDRFIRNPENKGHLMDQGLWGLSRHPNYFGEATEWWGIWIAALPATLAAAWWAPVVTLIASPVLITFFLLKVSGVPLLEAAMKERPGWSEYSRRVSMFIPWFPKK
jgi:steroid 5-alpha reductase family enzyme